MDGASERRADRMVGARQAPRGPDPQAADYPAFAKLMPRQGGRRLCEAIRCEGVLWERLIEPLMLAALNTDPRIGSAELAGQIVRETLAQGGRACAPRIADPSLDAAFIAPAVAFLAARGAEFRIGRRVEAVETAGDRANALRIGGEAVTLAPDDGVILATPAWTTPALLPGT